MNIYAFGPIAALLDAAYSVVRALSDLIEPFAGASASARAIVVITLLVVVPGIVKGERFTPGGQATADQWFGGPRSGTQELPAPDTDESKAGGASGRW